MNFDSILLQLGEFGPWQRRNNLLMWIPSAAAGVNVLIAAFAVMGPRYGYRCRNPCDREVLQWQPPGLNLSDIFPSFDNSSADFDPDNPDYCQSYLATKNGDSCIYDKSQTVKCHHGDDFVYASFEMDKTVATANDLVCGDYFWTIIIDEFYMLGLFIGSFGFGYISDKLGRRQTLLISIICCSTGNLLGCAMPNQWSYSLTRIVAAAGGEGIFLIVFTLALEYSGVRETVPFFSWVTWSTMLANVVVIPFALGEIIPALLAMGLKDWRTFQAAVSGIIASTGLVYFFIPESPRWLIANGRTDEAVLLINKAAEANNVKLSNNFELENQEETEEKNRDYPSYGVKDLFRKSQIGITIPMFICWPVITMLYYGLSLSADKIKMTDNVYLSYILVSLIEIPAYLLLPLIIDVWGRKPLFFITQFIPGICCIVAAFLTPGTAFFAFLTLSAKFGVSAAANVKYMYTAQLYPTSIRNTAVGTCSTIARIGGALSPIIGKFLIELGTLSETVPLCLFGGFGIVGGLCALLLPDTVGFPLPDSFEDVEKIKKNGKSVWTCYRQPV